MKLTVERIYQDIAILEKDDMSHIEISTSLLPKGFKEGTKLIFNGSDYLIDAEAEAEARSRIIEKQRCIFKKR